MRSPVRICSGQVINICFDLGTLGVHEEGNEYTIQSHLERDIGEHQQYLRIVAR